MNGKPSIFYNQDIELKKVLRASSSFPGVYSPMKINDVYYIDGGAISNLPYQAIDCLDVNATLAIDVIPTHEISKLPKNLINIVDRSLDILLHSQVINYYDKFDIVLNPIDVEINSFDIKRYDELIQLGYDSVIHNISKIKALL